MTTIRAHSETWLIMKHMGFGYSSGSGARSDPSSTEVGRPLSLLPCIYKGSSHERIFLSPSVGTGTDAALSTLVIRSFQSVSHRRRKALAPPPHSQRCRRQNAAVALLTETATPPPQCRGGCETLGLRPDPPSSLSRKPSGTRQRPLDFPGGVSHLGRSARGWRTSRATAGCEQASRRPSGPRPSGPAFGRSPPLRARRSPASAGSLLGARRATARHFVDSRRPFSATCYSRGPMAASAASISTPSRTRLAAAARSGCRMRS